MQYSPAIKALAAQKGWILFQEPVKATANKVTIQATYKLVLR